MANEQWQAVQANFGRGNPLSVASSSFRGAGQAFGNISDRITADARNKEKLAQQAIANERADSLLGIKQAQENRTQAEADRIAQQRNAMNTAFKSPDILETGATATINDAYKALDARLGTPKTEAEKAVYDTEVAKLNTAVQDNFSNRLQNPLRSPAQQAKLMQQGMINEGVDAPTAIKAANDYQATLATGGPNKELLDILKTAYSKDSSAIKGSTKGDSGRSRSKTSLANTKLVDVYADIDARAPKWSFTSGSGEDSGYSLKQKVAALNEAGVPPALISEAIGATISGSDGSFLDTRSVDEDDFNKYIDTRRDESGGFSGYSKGLANAAAKEASLPQAQAKLTQNYLKQASSAFGGNPDKRVGMSDTELGFGMSKAELDKLMGVSPKAAPKSNATKAVTPPTHPARGSNDVKQAAGGVGVELSPQASNRLDTLLEKQSEKKSAANIQAVQKAASESPDPYRMIRENAVNAYKKAENDKTLTPLETGAIQLLQRGIYGTSVLDEGLSAVDDAFDSAVNNLGIASSNAFTGIGNLFTSKDAQAPYKALDGDYTGDRISASIPAASDGMSAAKAELSKMYPNASDAQLTVLLQRAAASSTNPLGQINQEAVLTNRR